MAQTINVNTTPGQFMPTLYYSQGDIGRVYEIVLASSDGWTIPVGATVEMVATKPSGFGFTVSGTLSGNVASFTTTETMTNEWGRYPAEIRIKSGDDVIGTANFYLNGERNPHPDSTVDGDASEIIPELTLLVERVEAAAASVLDMNVVAETLPAGSDATYSYDEDTNTATFGIPRGADGEVSFASLNDATAVTSVSDSTPYLFRRTNGGNAGHNEMDTLVGGSVAFNQLMQYGDFASTTGWFTARGTITASNNKGTFTVTEVNAGNGIFRNNIYIKDHVYFASATLTPSKNTKSGFFFGGSVAVGLKSITANTRNVVETIAKAADNSGSVYVYCNRESALAVNDTCIYENVNVIDLTQMFGSTVADAIYAMEQATAGSGVAYFRSLFGASYYPYNNGELMSVSGVSSHDMRGFNAWDEEWENGFISASTGASISASDAIRSKNFIHILSNTTYYIRTAYTASNQRPYAFWYDADKNYISEEHANTGQNSLTTTSPANACYMKFAVANLSTPVTYNHDICINISSPKNGTYEPYEIHSYPLADVTLRGIPKWDSGLYYDGDVYEADGSVSRKYGVVDLGTLTWTAGTDSIGQYFQSSQISGKKLAPSGQNDNIVCAKYVTTVSSSVADKQIAGSSGTPVVYVRDLSYSTASAFTTAMNGVYLVYELATPTTETADPYQKAQICDPSGTEEYVSTSIVPVGHNTDYPKTILDIAPTANGNYVLKCTVSGGVPTYEWVSA